MARALRPYGLQIVFALYIPLILFLDARVANLPQQWALGAATFLLLYVSTRHSPPEERRQVWLCVLIATGFEVFGSLIWGLYRYRFANVPLYVPPGHGLVYLFGLTAARTPLLREHGRTVGRFALGLATAWAVSGLTWLPLLTGRVDLAGALCLPLFAWFVLRSPRGAVFVGIFFCTSLLEIFGTSFGNWRWAAAAPFIGVPTGNPPSVIAGGYCVIDGTVLLVASSLARFSGRFAIPTGLRRPGTVSTSAPAPAD